jgi:hypothetical protein
MIKQEACGMCWNCNSLGPLSQPKCKICGATNPNMDLDTAMQEVEDKTLITKDAP